MVTASVSIVFEDESIADAEAQIEAWSLHEGCQVTFNITEGVVNNSGVINAQGDLVQTETAETLETKREAS